jgi:tetratricopeptide (TPR) repeat protein
VTQRAGLAVTLAALAVAGAWPWFAAHRAQAAVIAPAPVNADYRHRDQLISFYERQTRGDAGDQISARLLANEYLQRFRETGDTGDILRAATQAARSLHLQPQGNVQALGVLAACDLTLHRFKSALRAVDDEIQAEPFNDNAWAQKASILMELGRYSEAGGILSRPHHASNPTWLSIRARYDELTGNLARARREMAEAAQIVDEGIETPVYTRSWYHVREGLLAFEAGDGARAGDEYDVALQTFPDNAAALMDRAKLYRARADWQRALTSATRSAQLYPLPQTLGYVADAQRALGDAALAAQTDALIRAEQRLFNARGMNDRLLAMYYAEHREHLNDALLAARSDLAKRGDEVYADDTVAWVLAAMGRWNEARAYAVRATRLGTQDPELQYHAGVIAWHTRHRAEARRRLSAALALDPSFHPVYAAIARRAIESGDAP